MKISIITPSYNQADFLPITIESVISQKGNFEIEYLIMDGGSSDESIKIIKKYARTLKGDKRISLYWESHKDNGQADAINRGIKLSHGDIIAYCNSDDEYRPETLAKVVEAFAQHPKKIWLTGYCTIINTRGVEIQKPVKQYKNLWLRHYSYKNLCITNFIAQPATFWRRSIHNKIGYFDEKLHYVLDYDFWLRAGRLSDPIVIKDNLSSFRIHHQSKGERGYVIQFQEDMEIVQRYTQDKNILSIHSLNNFGIKCVYRIIK